MLKTAYWCIRIRQSCSIESHTQLSVEVRWRSSGVYMENREVLFFCAYSHPAQAIEAPRYSIRSNSLPTWSGFLVLEVIRTCHKGFCNSIHILLVSEDICSYRFIMIPESKKHTKSTSSSYGIAFHLVVQ